MSNGISKKIDEYAKSNIKSLRAAEEKSGRKFTKYDIAQMMLSRGKLSRNDFALWMNTREGYDNFSLTKQQKQALKNGSIWGLNHGLSLNGKDKESYLDGFDREEYIKEPVSGIRIRKTPKKSKSMPNLSQKKEAETRSKVIDTLLSNAQKALSLIENYHNGIGYISSDAFVQGMNVIGSSTWDKVTGRNDFVTVFENEDGIKNEIKSLKILKTKVNKPMEFEREFKKLYGVNFNAKNFEKLADVSSKMNEMNVYENLSEYFSYGINELQNGDASGFKPSALLAPLFKNNMMKAQSFIENLKKECSSDAELKEKLIEVLKESKSEAEKTLKSYNRSQIEKEYKQSYKSAMGSYKSDEVIEKYIQIQKMNAMATEVAGTVALGLLTSGSTAVLKLSSRAVSKFGVKLGGQVMKAGMTASMAAVPAAETVVGGLTSKDGLTAETGEEAWEELKNGLMYGAFGAYVSGPLGNVVSKVLSKNPQIFSQIVASQKFSMSAGAAMETTADVLFDRITSDMSFKESMAQNGIMNFGMMFVGARMNKGAKLPDVDMSQVKIEKMRDGSFNLKVDGRVFFKAKNENELALVTLSLGVRNKVKRRNNIVIGRKITNDIIKMPITKLKTINKKFAVKKTIMDTHGYKNSDWVRANMDKFLEECKNPYYGSPIQKIGDRVKHPELSTHKVEVLTAFLSDPKLYDNPKLREDFEKAFRLVHDANSAKNLINGFNYYLEHKEYHKNPNVEEVLGGLLLNVRMSIEKKAKVFNLIANDSKLSETKQSFLNYNETKLDQFVNSSDEVDIDLAYRILHDTNDNNGVILHRILNPHDECYSEIIAFYKKFIDNPEYNEILNDIIFRYQKGSKQILDIMLNDKEFPKDLMPGILSRYNGLPAQAKSFIEELCSKKDFPKEQIVPIIRSTMGLFEGGWNTRGTIILTNFAKYLVNNTKIPTEQVPQIVSLVNTEKAISFVKDICQNFETKGLYVEQVVPLIKNGNLDADSVAKINKMLPKERVVNFNDAELAVVSGAYNFLGKKHIHELSKPQKRTLLNLLLQNKKAAESGELAGIKDLIPYFPENTEEYTRIMKDLSRSMNLSVETLDNNTIELFNKNLIDLAEIIKSKSASKNIDLAITHKDFIKGVNELLKDLPKDEALKIQSQFGFKIENGKLTGYPQCNSSARSDINELVSRYTKNNFVKISGNPELEGVLNNLIKICPEIMNQIDGSNQFSKTLSSIHNMAKRPEFNKLNAEDKTVLMLAALLNNVDKSINSRMDTAFDAYFISKKFNLSEDAAQKLYSIIELSDAPERFMDTTKKITRKMVGVQELVGQERVDTFDLIATKLKEGNTFELAKLLYSSQYERGFTRNFDKILEDRIMQIKANDFILPQTPAETYYKFAQSTNITRDNTQYSVKIVNAEDIPDLKAFTHAPDVGYITGGSRDANFANFDFFKLTNDDKIICTCYVSNDHYGPVKQFKNGFIFDVDDTKQYVGYGTDIWSIGKNIPDIVIEYFRDKGIASAKNRGAKFEQRAYISEQLKSILYPEDTSFSGKIKKWADNLFTSTEGLSNTDLQYIHRLENIKTQLRGKPFTIQNIENIDPEFAQAYKTFLDSQNSILVDNYHNEVLVSNPKITAIFTADIDKIPEEYLKKAQDEGLPIVVFKPQTK